MIHRNIHLAGLSAPSPAPEAAPKTAPAEALPRLRAVGNSPAQEYAQRPGAVVPLADSVCAMILCKSGRRRVERHQITANVDGTERSYSSTTSMTIAAENGTGRAVLWVANRRDPSVIHILRDDGSYVESIGLKGEAQWFSQDELSKEAIAATKTHLRREQSRLELLHEPETAAAAERDAHNAAQAVRMVHTFPAEAVARADEQLRGGRPPAATPAESPKAEAFRAAVGNLEEQRGRKAEEQRATQARVSRETGTLEDLMGVDTPERSRVPAAPEAEELNLADLF